MGLTALIVAPLGLALGLVGYLIYLHSSTAENKSPFIVTTLVLSGAMAIGALFLGEFGEAAARTTTAYVCRPGSVMKITVVKRNEARGKTSYSSTKSCITKDGVSEQPQLPPAVLLVPVVLPVILGLACLLAALFFKFTRTLPQDPERKKLTRAAWAGAVVLAAGLVVPGLLIAKTDFDARAPALKAFRPEPLTPKPGCTLWKGMTAHRKNPLNVVIRWCRKGDDVEAEAQWFNAVVGWSRRAAKGRWHADTKEFRLREKRFLKLYPGPGYRHCLIDRLILRPTNDFTITGTYESDTCSDKSSFTVTRVATPTPR